MLPLAPFPIIERHPYRFGYSFSRRLVTTILLMAQDAKGEKLGTLPPQDWPALAIIFSANWPSRAKERDGMAGAGTFQHDEDSRVSVLAGLPQLTEEVSAISYQSRQSPTCSSPQNRSRPCCDRRAKQQRFARTLQCDLPEMLKSDSTIKLDRLYAIKVPPSCIS